MAKKSKKVPMDKECVMEALHLRNCSIRKLGKDVDHFEWSSKSIERGLKDGEASPDLLDALGKYLNVEPDYLSGKYHRECEKIKDIDISSAMKRNLHAEQFPYLKKQKRTLIEGKFIYEKCLEYLLISHDISPIQFEEMTFEQKKIFQSALENAIAPVLLKHFPQNAMGHNSFPEIYELLNSIEEYNPDEPEPEEDFFSDNVPDRFS